MMFTELVPKPSFSFDKLIVQFFAQITDRYINHTRFIILHFSPKFSQNCLTAHNFITILN
jgi:prephenate dehydratase